MGLQTFSNNFALLAEAPNFSNRFRILALELAFSGNLDPGNTQSWIEKKVDEIASLIQPGFACNKKHQVEAGQVHLRTHNIDIHGKLNFDLMIRIDPTQVDERKAYIKQGDLIFNNTNSQELVGKTCLVDRDYEFAYSNHLTLIRLKDGYEPNYVVRYFNLLWRRGFFSNLCNRWIGQAGINTNILKNLTIPFPRPDEQERIVAEIDELMLLCDELEVRQQVKRESRVRLNAAVLAPLKKAASLTPEEFQQATIRLANNFDTLCESIDAVSKLRATILQLAVQGKLAAQNPSDEPSSVLLEKINQEQKRLLSEGKIKRLNIPPIDLSQAPFNLPAGWTWSRFPELGEFSRGRSKHRPRNAPELYEGGEYKFVQTGDVARANGIITTFTALYNEAGLTQSRMWPAGTMCITIAANIADSGILEFDACFPDSVVGFVPSNIIGSAQYFEYFMRTAKSHLQDFAPSTAQKNINLAILQELLIPLPPLAEQKRIVAKVNQLMSLCDELEAKLRQAEAHSEKLMNAAVKHVLDSVRDTSNAAEEVFA